MKKWIKVTISIIAVLLLVGSSMLILINKGILVTPTDKSLINSKEVPSYDVLEWQFERENEILVDYKASVHTFENPYIIVDPYDMNPNTALVIFDAMQPGEIKVTVQGDDEFATYRYTKSSSTTHFEIQIIGLYSGRKNSVILNDQQGKQTTLEIETEPLPVDFQTYELEKSLPEKMEPGITLFTACFEHSYSALLDHNAQVRGYLSNRFMAHGTSMIQLKNGNMLSTGDEYKQIPYNMASLWEFNWLGKIFREYEIPNGVHHGISELPNGDILAVSNNKNMFTSGTREDVVIVIDRATGEVKKEYDFRTILDEKREPHHHFHPNILHSANIDWMHTNSAIFNPDDNTLIVSSPTQSQVVAIDADTSQIRWILGPHDGYEGSSEYLKPYLLTPTGSNFEWQWGQHDPMLLPDQDNDPNTIDLLLFDNGQSRSFSAAKQVDPQDNYSRGVQYRINQKAKTVEQIWQYGKECGAMCYATFLGDADYLPATKNRLITFGGEIRADGIPVDDIINGVFGDLVTNSRVIEVSEKGEVEFSVTVKDNKYTQSAETYQAERLIFYSPASFGYSLGEVKGKRLGNSYTCEATELIKAPAFYGGKLEVTFDRIFMENHRLVADGKFMFNGKTYLLGRTVLILRSKENVYLYAANSGLNGRFFMSLNTSQLKSGTYQLSIAGAVLEGNDQASPIFLQGHVKTEYKITVP